MPSESESFLGIKENPASTPPVAKSILRRRVVWVLTPIISYCLSITWLTGAIVCVPYVIFMAPLGLTSLFNPPVNHASARVGVGLVEYLIHFVFWTLFLTGLIACKRLPRWLLRLIFITITVILVLTMYGCSKYYSIDTSQLN